MEAAITSASTYAKGEYRVQCRPDLLGRRWWGWLRSEKASHCTFFLRPEE